LGITDDTPPADEPAAEKIHRSRGSTASERLLADLGEQASLILWSYPNLFYDKKQKGKGDGKELCDMLVACGDDVIIFSDKHIN
jgi:predicted solute-binding protein